MFRPPWVTLRWTSSLYGLTDCLKPTPHVMGDASSKLFPGFDFQVEIDTVVVSALFARSGQMQPLVNPNKHKRYFGHLQTSANSHK